MQLLAATLAFSTLNCNDLQEMNELGHGRLRRCTTAAWERDREKREKERAREKERKSERERKKEREGVREKEREREREREQKNLKHCTDVGAQVSLPIGGCGLRLWGSSARP